MLQGTEKERKKDREKKKKSQAHHRRLVGLELTWRRSSKRTGEPRSLSLSGRIRDNKRHATENGKGMSKSKQTDIDSIKGLLRFSFGPSTAAGGELRARARAVNQEIGVGLCPAEGGGIETVT